MWKIGALLLLIQTMTPITFFVVEAARADDCSVNELKLITPKAETATEELNRIITRKYPNLKFITADPDAFMTKVRDRFNKQKAITPNDPYLFDFSEMGMSLLNDMKRTADERIVKLKTALAEKKLKASTRKEMNIDLQYLDDVSKELQEHLDHGKIAYRPLIETSFFYNRAMGYFDAREQGIIQRLSLTEDRIQNGYHQYSIAKEYEIYKKRKFSLFVGKSPVPTYQEGQPLLEKFLSDPNELRGILLPSNEPIWLDIFFQLMPREIYPIGVTATAIQADGILRPPGDFWNHDLRHSATELYKRTRYIRDAKLNPAQVKALNAQMDAWFVEFLKKVDTIEDPQLKKAVWMIVFNTHHDRGILFTPSAYTKGSPSLITRALYSLMKLNKEIPVGEHFPLSDGYKWLQEFWGPKRDVEKQLVGKMPKS